MSDIKKDIENELETIEEYGYCKECSRLLPNKVLIPIIILKYETINIINGSYSTYNKYFICKECKKRVDHL